MILWNGIIFGFKCFVKHHHNVSVYIEISHEKLILIAPITINSWESNKFGSYLQKFQVNYGIRVTANKNLCFNLLLASCVFVENVSLPLLSSFASSSSWSIKITALTLLQHFAFFFTDGKISPFLFSLQIFE